MVYISLIYSILQGEGHNLYDLGLSMYEENVTNRLIQVASVLEGLKLIQKKSFRVQNFENVTYAYVGPDVVDMLREVEFRRYQKTADLKKITVPVKKFHVDKSLFLPYLQKRRGINKRP